MRLQDRVAIITWAGGGIGRAAVHEFAAEGATVTAVDINSQGLDETVGLAEAVREQVTAHVADVSKAAQVEQVVTSATDRSGRLDVVFSNAAIMRKAVALI